MEGNWQHLLHLTGSKQSAMPQTTIAARTARNVVRNQHQFLHVAARYFVIRDSGKKRNRHFHFSQTKLAAFPPSLSLSISLSRYVCLATRASSAKNHGKQFDQKANKQRIW